ncbi:hypothetical protein T01_16086 [Trichinella spiralis]|uniref:Secreted protein n=1 Tax=Trichinella spiralis TaxID=6334 RepID=A0A0V1AI81_TRISP|nr:hypothetical protein T01_16086 [Trichinella spiralis]
MSGSSICLNLLLIAVRLPIFLNVSIAVSHVPKAAPLLGLPHCQSNNEFDAVCSCNWLRSNSGAVSVSLNFIRF